MRNKKFGILFIVLLGISGLFTPKETLAVVQNLNAQTGQTQTFQNDTNLRITSANNVHSLGWLGLLPVSRGGTGTGSFTSGSVLFSNGTSISQNNSNLFWDNTNNRLGIGTSSPTSTFDVHGDTSISGNLEVGSISGADAVINNTNGEDIFVSPGAGLGTGNGGELNLIAGSGGETGQGAGVHIEGGRGGATSGDGGPINFFGGAAQTGNASGGTIGFYGAAGQGSGIGSSITMSAGSGGATGPGGYFTLQAGSGGGTSGDGGGISFVAGDAAGGDSNGGDVTFGAGRKSGTGTNGIFKFYGQAGVPAILDLSLVAASNKTFTLPNNSGTFGLLETDQTWSGLNKFEAGTNSTIYVGSSVKSGCIAMGDSDGNGVTYITANDGVLSASSTKPSFCQ